MPPAVAGVTATHQVSIVCKLTSAVPVLNPSVIFENVVDALNGVEGLLVVSVHVESVEQPTLDDSEGVPDIVAEPGIAVGESVVVDDCLGLVDDDFDLFE